MRAAYEASSRVTGLFERVTKTLFTHFTLAMAALFLASGMAYAQVGNTVGNFAGAATGGWSGGANPPVTGPSDGSCANIGNIGSQNATSGYGFNIPANATITDINFYVDAAAGNTDEQMQTQLASDASVTPVTPIGTSNDVTILGLGANCASTDVHAFFFSLADWGTDSATVTPAVVNNPNFGINFTTLESSSIKVDSNCLEIEYTTPSGPATQIGCFTVQFTVNKDFSDNNPTPVEITLSCLNADDITANPLMASEGNPAVFAVRDNNGDATCTAMETAGLPAGYAKDESDCQQPGLPADGGECTIVNTLQAPSMAVTKTVTNAGPFGAGDTINYTIEVTNDGPVTLTNVVVNDPLLGLVDEPCSASLDPGLSCQVMGSYMVTQGDIDDNGGGDGDIDNTAEGNSDQVGPEPASAEAQLVAQDPSLAVNKMVTNTGPFGAGDTIMYTIEVTNDGNTTLTNVVVNDPLLGLTDEPCAASLAPGESCQVMGSYMVTQGDIDNNGGGDGDIDNTAEANSDQAGPQQGMASATLETPAPSLGVTKMVTNQGPFGAGDTIMYTIEVTNNGNTTLNNVVVSDPLLGLTDEPCAATLAPGESCQVMGSYMVTQGDIDDNGGGDGDIDNTATANSDEAGPQDAMAAAQLVTPNPLMSVTKTVTNTGSGPGGSFDVGDTIMYTIEVTNDGNTTLNNIVVSDPLLGLTDEPCAASLAPGESCQVMGSYMVTQGDIDDNGGGDGDIDNTATANSDEAGPEQASAEAQLAGVPALSVTKTVTNAGPFGAGDTIMYTIEVTNDGNTTLNNVVVSDPLLGLTNEPCAATLDPAMSCQVMGSYMVTQADIDDNGGGDGDIDNTATADSDEAGPEQASAEAALVAQVQSLGVTKMVTNQGPFGAGDTIMYTIEVTNTGNTTLNNVVVSDPLLGLTDEPCAATLAPGESCQVMGSYMVTQGDIDDNGGGDGDIDNTATANSDEAGPQQAMAEAQLVASDASLAVTKTVTNTGSGPGGTFDVGDTIMYTIEVTNDGNTTLNNVVVSDPLLGLTDEPCAAVLDPGMSCQLMGSYMVTQGDIDDNGGGDGDIDNTATANSDEAGPQQASAAAPLVPLNPDIELTKSASPTSYSMAGDVITYTFLVENTGSVTLFDIDVLDPLITDPPNSGMITCPSGNPIPSLDPGASESCTGTYTVTEDDVLEGEITNLATVTADCSTPGRGEACTADDDSEVVDGEDLRTTFRVQKDFSDDNPASVTVSIQCNTGLPLYQEGEISEFGNPFDFVEFVVTDFEPGTMDCDIEEVIPAGYEPTYTASATTGVADNIFSDEDGCHYELIEGGQFTCDIFNELQPVDVVVEKEWIDENPQFQQPTTVEVTLECDGDIIDGFPCLGFEGGGGNECSEQFIDPNNPGVWQVLPHFEGTECTATEESIVGVETDESDCEELIVFPGQGDSCVIVNTRLYAGIPTLSQYGLMLLALLMLGMGAIAYRRFV